MFYIWCFDRRKRARIFVAASISLWIHVSRVVDILPLSDDHGGFFDDVAWLGRTSTCLCGKLSFFLALYAEYLAWLLRYADTDAEFLPVFCVSLVGEATLISSIIAVQAGGLQPDVLREISWWTTMLGWMAWTICFLYDIYPCYIRVKPTHNSDREIRLFAWYKCNFCAVVDEEPIGVHLILYFDRYAYTFRNLPAWLAMKLSQRAIEPG